MTFLSLLSVLFMSLVASPQVTGSEALLDAARTGDRATVARLLAEGADVNSSTRYGVTPLFYACDRGDVELAKLLIEKGANVNAQDNFYQATPLTWAMSNDHVPIMELLLDAGAEGGAAVIQYAIRQDNLQLFEKAVRSKGIEAKDLSNALEMARRTNRDQFSERLIAAGAAEAPAEETVKVDPSVLRQYVGHYKNEDIGMSIEIRLEGDELVGQPSGQPPLRLAAISERVFKAIEVEGIQVSFSGRGGTVESMTVRQGGNNMGFQPYDPEADAEIARRAAEASDLPALEEVPKGTPVNWGGFRGPGASGIGDSQGVPWDWDSETGKNIKWRTEIGGIGNSSPVIWGNRVFVSTAISHAGDTTFRTGLYGDVVPVEDLSVHDFKLIALDRDTGKIVWEKTVYTGEPKVKRHTKASQANSTPVTDGERVVVLFGSIGKLACYDFNGRQIWTKDVGILDSGWFYNSDYQWGHSSSPVIFRDRVIVQADISKGSHIAAYSLEDGSQLWRTDRDEISTWATPAIFQTPDRFEIVTNGPKIRSYDASTGKLLWELGPSSEVVVATPVVYDGMVYITAGYPPVRPIYVVRPGGAGDLSLPKGTDSSDHVAWSTSRGGTYIPTPIVYRGVLYMNANNGRLTAYDAKTGEQLFRARIGDSAGSYAASPVAADGRLFFTTEEGETHVVRAGRSYQYLGKNKVAGTVMATPAISDGVLVIRALGEVFGIAK